MSIRARWWAWLLGAAMTGALQAQAVLHDFQGKDQFDFLGAEVSDAGDVDADGHGDLAIGAYGYGSGARVDVRSGQMGALLFSVNVQGLGGVSGAGDVDGDGRDDLVVGDLGFAGAGSGTGLVTVVSGSTGLPICSIAGTAAKDYFGAAVDGAGDVDADGFPDVLVGAPQYGTPTPGAGYARVYSGASCLLVHQFLGVSSGDEFGRSVAGAGDVDADGYSDLLVGAPGDDNFGTSSGSASLFSGQSGAPLCRFDGALPDERLGWSVAGPGDVDGDGGDDLLFGIPGESSAALLAGSARLVSGATCLPLQEFFGSSVAATLGTAVSGAGDMDLDGVPDLAAGKPGGPVGAVFVWSGASAAPLFSVTGTNMGNAVSAAGNANADCHPDLIVGDPIYSGPFAAEIGRTIVYSLDSALSEPLSAFPCEASLAVGGVQAFSLQAGKPLGGKLYFLAGTASGTAPGLSFADVTVPLNPDVYFFFTVNHPNEPPLLGSFGLLDGQGKGTAQFILPAGTSASLAGLTLHHAFVALDPATLAPLLASNAAPILLAP